MIKFEHNMLVLNNAFSRDDVEQINAFAEYVRGQERDRIIALLETMNCHGDIAVQCDCGSYWEAIALIKGENE